MIVNKDNALDSLSKNALVRILKAEDQFWKEGGKIQIILPKAGSNEKKYLLENIFKMSDDELKRHWAELIFRNKLSEPPSVLPSAVVTIGIVAKRKDAVAFVDITAIDKNPNVKVLQIDGKSPGAIGYVFKDSKNREGSGVADPDVDESSGAKPVVDNSSSAQPATAARQDDEDLKRRIEELERTVTDLAAGTAASDKQGFDLGPLFKLRGFGHIQFQAEDVDPDGGEGDSSNNFALGGLDLFLTSQLSDRISFLNETVFEATASGETVLDVERLIIKYTLGDHFTVQAGRFHTTLGYWNETFHHGEWLQTTVGRPNALNFEDENGILPVHMVGLVLQTEHVTDALEIGYTLEVGNGRGPTPDPPQIADDGSDSKAINFALSLSPRAIEGLRLGLNWYEDDIPENTDAAAGTVHGAQDERILGAFGAYRIKGWEVLTEAFDIRHEEGGTTADSSGGYFQLARRFGDWTPFARWDFVHIDDDDTYYADQGDRETLALGVRWDLASWNAIKLQLSRTEFEAAAGGIDETRNAIAVQTAFAF